MVLGIILIVAALIGLINGIKKKSRTLVLISAIALIAFAAIGFYFYTHPY